MSVVCFYSIMTTVKSGSVETMSTNGEGSGKSLGLLPLVYGPLPYS